MTTYRKQWENKFENKPLISLTQIENLRTYKDEIIKLGVIWIIIVFGRVDRFGDLIKLWISLINKIRILIEELISLET